MNGLILYTTEDGTSRIRLRADGQTVWLTQLDMAELFQTSKQNIAKHLKAIFADGELHVDSVVNQWLTTAADGKNYRVAHYNLDAILAVGYRVRSPRGVQFRRWASTVLAEYLRKGFVLDDERLKNPDGRPDHFDEMLARIRDFSARQPQRHESRRMHEVVVGGEQGKFVFDAQPGNERVDGAELHALASARVAQPGGLDVGVARGIEERQHLQALDDACLVLGAAESLQQFLQHDAGDDDAVALHQRLVQPRDGRMIGRRVPAQCERPHAGVDQQTRVKRAHRRLRSALGSKLASHSSWPSRSAMRACSRRAMNSLSARVTAAFFDGSPLMATARSIRAGSRARLVATTHLHTFGYTFMLRPRKVGRNDRIPVR